MASAVIEPEGRVSEVRVDGLVSKHNVSRKGPSLSGMQIAVSTNLEFSVRLS